ncbi:hypothetical protein CSOJ01_03946 [Colletotrichum sojae]|uniref:Uncharacterized protein n=1 Tax=Colletotrichum sojae TaxID=2175907 RepID=A0A8H6JKY5_9PEZI|nr:hypothetical protein CSOJ01_03946 [Colletotrichum sojae]
MGTPSAKLHALSSRLAPAPPKAALTEEFTEVYTEDWTNHSSTKTTHDGDNENEGNKRMTDDSNDNGTDIGRYCYPKFKNTVVAVRFRNAVAAFGITPEDSDG